MRIKTLSRLVCGAALALVCSCSNPTNPLLGLFDLRAETFQRVYSLGGTENRTDEIMALLNRTMLSAQTSLYCSFEDVNMPWVVSALLFHRNRGIDVKIGIDEDNKDGIGFNQLAAFLDSSPLSSGRRLFVGNGGTGQVYLNTCVADNTRVWVSSIAPSLPGAYQMAGFGYYFQSEEDGIARKFAVEMDLVTHGSFGSAKQRLNRRNHWLVGEVDVGIYMAPAESPLGSFLASRVQTTRQSVLVYGSEFFANKLDSSSSASGKVRKAGDLAFDMSNGPATVRQATAGWWTYKTDDPDEKNKLNSMNYLKGRGNVELLVRPGGFPSNGVNIVLLDNRAAAFNPATRTENTPMAMIMTHPLSTRADSSHDGAMFIFENATVIDEITDFYNQLAARSVPEGGIGTTGQTIATASQGEVVISELNYMGGYETTGTKRDSADYVELFNNTSAAINISRWRMNCATSSGFPGTTQIVFPDRTLIGPRQYFVVTRSGSTSSVVIKPNLVLGSSVPTCTAGSATPCAGGFASIAQTGLQQCRLTDASGTIVDLMGAAGTTFSTNNRTNDTTGINDDLKVTRRSMERLNNAGRGDDLSNWYTNRNPNWATNYNIKPLYIQRTFGTPGYENSPKVDIDFTDSVPPPPAIVISEVGGCRYTSSAGGPCTTPTANDEFVELYNPTGAAISIGGVIICRRASTGGSPTTWATIPGGTSIAANGFYLIGGAGYTAGNYAGTPAADLAGTGTALTSGSQTVYAISFGSCADEVPVIADAVSIGTLTDAATWLPLPTITTIPADGQSIERKACSNSTADANVTTGMYGAGGHALLGNSYKTGRSDDSWILQTTPNPRNSSATEVPGGGCSVLAPFSVNSATATSATSVNVTFSHTPNTAVAETPGNYVITGGAGVAVSGASLSGNIVTLTTAAQVVGQAYVVTVSNVTRASDSGALVGTTGNFTGYSPVANLKISEVSVDGGGDSLEFIVTSAGSITGMQVYVKDVLTYTFPAASAMSVGDIIVLHAQASGTDETGGNPTASGDAGATAGYDFWDNTIGSITSTDMEVAVATSTGTYMDYVAWSDGAFGSGQSTRVSTRVAAGDWTFEDSLTEFYLVDSTLDNGSLCLQRFNTGVGTQPADTNSVGDWTAGACNLGTNPSITSTFNVVSATSASSINTVDVVFSNVPQKTAAETPGNYAITGGVTATSAVLNGKTVTLGTTDQTGGQAYTLTVSNALRFNDGAALTTTAAAFSGYATPAAVKITEVYVYTTGDSIEFRVVSAGPLTGMRVYIADTLRYTFPTTPIFSVGDIIVFHAQAAGTNETGGNPLASVDTGATPGYDFWDSPGAAITATDNEIEVKDALGTTSYDYVAYVDGAFGGGQAARVEAHITSGHWTRAAGAVATTDLLDATLDGGGNCMKRKNTGAGTAHTDTNGVSDWLFATCSLGTNDAVP